MHSTISCRKKIFPKYLLNFAKILQAKIFTPILRTTTTTPMPKLNTLEHSKIVKDLNHKKLVHLIHKQFRESDRRKTLLKQEEQTRRDDLIVTASSARSTMTRSQSTPQLEINRTQQMIEEIKYHTESQRRQQLLMSRTNFSNVIETARAQVSKLPFSPVQHKKWWYATAGSLNVPPKPSGGLKDKSKHHVGEFTNQWFERDKDGLQNFLTSPTKDRTRMTRAEFFKACVASTSAHQAAHQAHQQLQQPQHPQHPQQPQQTQAHQETEQHSLLSPTSLWSDPSTDGRLQVYNMLVSSDNQSSCVIKRKAWKLLRSDRGAKPILDACPQLMPLAGKPRPLWSNATGHDKPLPRQSISCNMEAQLPIKSMRSTCKKLRREIKLQNPLGLSLRQCATRQESLKAEHFLANEIKKLKTQTPSVIRKEQDRIKAHRFAELEARKAKKLAKKTEALRMQSEKAARQAKAMEIYSRPSTALENFSDEEKIEQAAKILQRVGKGFLYRKRKEEQKGEEE